MSDRTYDEAHESRTQLIGAKRPLGNSSMRSRKRRRNGANKHRQPITSTDNAFTVLSHRDESSHDSSDYYEPSMMSANNSKMTLSTTMPNTNTDFGRNRLASGFVRNDQVDGPVRDSTDDSKESGQITGDSAFSAIEISDDEMEESEGGMVINLDGQHTNTSRSSSRSMDTQESGEIEDSQSRLFVIDSAPTLPIKRLCDLDPHDFEEQITYAFFHLDRSQIDTNRPVICLKCMREGHLHGDCGRAGDDGLDTEGTDQFKLWISCCVCASKQHLVGDCSRFAGRVSSIWSLKGLNRKKIINLSLQSGTKQLEVEAANRNMRPAGLQIRGRAGMHHADDRSQDIDSSDDEPFLRKPVARPSTDRPVDDIRPYRGGGAFYQTDSFGRRRSRSRSPHDGWDSYRPRDHRHLDTNSRQESRHTRFQSPPRRGNYNNASNVANSNQQGSSFQSSLPTRQGSHVVSNPGQGSNRVQTMGQKNGVPQSKKHKKGKKKGQAN